MTKAKHARECIKRIDTNTRGWQVVVRRRGKEYSKLFSDSMYGGYHGALRSAKEYRDELFEELPPPKPPPGRFMKGGRVRW